MKSLRSVLVLGVSLLFTGPLFAQEGTAKTDIPPSSREKKAKLAPRTYGTGNTSFYRMGAPEFSLLFEGGSVGYSDMAFAQPNFSSFRRYAYSDSGGYYFVGTPHLPSGAKLIAINLHNCVDADNNITGAVFTCNNYGSSCDGLGSILTTVGCGYDSLDLAPSGHVVDNSPDGNYLVILLTTSTNGPDSFAGVTIEYQLQVSPAPAVANFRTFRRAIHSSNLSKRSPPPASPRDAEAATTVPVPRSPAARWRCSSRRRSDCNSPSREGRGRSRCPRVTASVSTDRPPAQIRSRSSSTWRSRRRESSRFAPIESSSTTRARRPR